MEAMADLGAGLGFAQLLGIAQGKQTDKTVSSNQLLKTKFSGPKKEKGREKGKVAPNVQKFLQKKEAEEKRQRIEKKLQLEKLKESRTDREKNKISKHLKVTKSANYSVLADAVDHNDTAVTLNGRKQCDEDDYGFASKTSQGLYEKLMSKYEADPEDPMAKFSRSKPKVMKDLSSAKDRVKEALRKEEENAAIPGKRRSKVNESEKVQPGCVGNRGVGAGRDRDREKSSTSSTKSREEIEKEKRKREIKEAKSEKERKEEEARRKRILNAKRAPPPVDFQSLLQLANQKKDIPIKVEKKKSAKESEFGARPMTEQEKKEYMRENEAKLRREGKLPKVPERRRDLTPEIDLRDSRKPAKAPEPGPQFHKAVKKTMPEERKGGMGEFEREKKEMERKIKELEQRKLDMENEHKTAQANERKRLEQRRAEMDSKQKIAQYNEKKRLDYQKKAEDDKRREIERRRAERKREDDKKDLDDMQSKYKEMQRKMKDMEARLKGGSGSSSSGGKRDPHNVEARRFPGEKGGRDQGGESSYKRRIESDSEEEYDSELDDFIDDSGDKMDIGKEIRSIFGYDKRKYQDEDFDDRSMENNRFSSIMMEEARSARIGRQEDLEDMRREEEENKKKKKYR